MDSKTLLKLVEIVDGEKTPSKTEREHGPCIVVLDRGFVYYGEVETNSEWCLISNAKNIRIWGTSKGLGQLALEGPQKETKLDNSGTVRAPLRAVISIISCPSKGW